MKKILLIFFINIIFLNFNFFSYAEKKSSIILKVENEIISDLDLKNKILSTLILSNQKINQESINSVKKQSLELLLQYKLKKIELSKYNYKINDNQIKSYLNSISNNDIDNLKKIFNSNNLDFKLFLDEVETEFKWQRFIYQKYSKKIDIEENIISKALQEKIKNDSSFKEFKLAKIEILLENNESDVNKIEQLKKHIQNFGFESAATKFNSTNSPNNNELGWISSEALSSTFSNIVSNLKIGQISKVIKTPDSAIVLKLIDKKNSKINEEDIEKLKENIINQKKNELFDLYSNSHLSKLKNTSYITYK